MKIVKDFMLILRCALGGGLGGVVYALPHLLTQQASSGWSVFILLMVIVASAFAGTLIGIIFILLKLYAKLTYLEINLPTTTRIAIGILIGIVISLIYACLDGNGYVEKSILSLIINVLWYGVVVGGLAGLAAGSLNQSALSE